LGGEYTRTRLIVIFGMLDVAACSFAVAVAAATAPMEPNNVLRFIPASPW
jgi:hypothetical protein